MASRRNLKAAMAKSGGVNTYVNHELHEKMTDEQLMEAVFKSRDNQDIDVSQKMANDNKRNTYLRKAGFDFLDVNELQPHPDNPYTVDEESIEQLSGLIYETKQVQPLVVRETTDGIQIVDGERRWRALKILADRYGDIWRMAPVRRYALGEMSDEQAFTIMHSNNIGQREMTPSERTMGYRALAKIFDEQRKRNPEAFRGTSTKTLLAERFGVSERTVMTNLAIAKGLSSEGQALYDRGKVTKAQAEKLSRLSEDQQAAIAGVITAQNISHEEADQLIEIVGEGSDPKDIDVRSLPSPKARPLTMNDHLKKARNSLKRAMVNPEEADFALIGEIKQLIRKIESTQES